MASRKPVIHASDHLPGHADPITFPVVVDSIDGGAGGPLTGDVTFSGGSGITLTQAGQNIEIASTPLLPHARVLTSAYADAPISYLLGGKQYHSSVWEYLSSEITHNEIGATHYPVEGFVGGASIVIGAGLYMISAGAEVTLPAQSAPRELILYGALSTLPVEHHRTYIPVTTTSDLVVGLAWNRVHLFTGSGNHLAFCVLEDDYSGTRTGSTLSSAASLLLEVVRLA